MHDLALAGGQTQLPEIEKIGDGWCFDHYKLHRAIRIRGKTADQQSSACGFGYECAQRQGRPGVQALDGVGQPSGDFLRETARILPAREVSMKNMPVGFAQMNRVIFPAK